MVGTGGRVGRGAAALMLLAVSMVALSFVVPPTAAAVLRLASIVPMLLALALAVAAAGLRGTGT